MIHSRAFSLDKTEVRSLEDGKTVFRGHAAVYNVLSRPLPELGGARERILPGTFTRSLEDHPDVIFTFNHDPSKVLGRTSAGTLKVWEDRSGLAVEGILPNTTYAHDLRESISRGDISEMSFRFRNPVGTWDYEDGDRVRSISECQLVDVAAVTLGAYAEPVGTVEERMLSAAMDELRAGRVLSSANRDAINEIIRQLQALLNSASDGSEERSAPLTPERYRHELREREFRFHTNLTRAV